MAAVLKAMAFSAEDKWGLEELGLSSDTGTAGHVVLKGH
jgi:hypothetical protein